MPIIKPTNKAVTRFEGLHLYHNGFSNCAMRVCLTLEEKGLSWQSHHLDIMNGEHLSQEYFGINPNGVVPTLIDNGVVIVDSADIIDYLDKKYSSNSLRPNTEQDIQAMYEWMYMARDNHLSIKTYMYYHLLNKTMKKSTTQMAQYRQLQQADTALLEFHERFSSADSFSSEDIDAAASVLHQCFSKMNDRLKDNQWLVADEFSLADIAWISQLVILSVAKYPFDNYPHLAKWQQTIFARESFKNGVLKWLPKKLAA